MAGTGRVIVVASKKDLEILQLTLIVKYRPILFLHEDYRNAQIMTEILREVSHPSMDLCLSDQRQISNPEAESEIPVCGEMRHLLWKNEDTKPRFQKQNYLL